MGALEFERSGVGGAIGRENTIRDLIKIAKEKGLNKEQLVRQKLAQFYIESNVVRYIGLRNLTHQLRGERPGPEGSVGRVFATEYGHRLQDFAVQLQGPYATIMKGSKYAIEDGRWQQSFLGSRGASIATGTTEIQKNVIAQRVLGLPRG
jgi:alkylation response protein AidB-like acyl-CoA dehydrogenase